MTTTFISVNGECWRVDMGTFNVNYNNGLKTISFTTEEDHNITIVEPVNVIIDVRHNKKV